jgi:hypothetical protein
MTYIVTTEDLLSQVAPPNLPAPTKEYSPLFFEQFNNVLRLYFNQLNKIVSQLNTNAGSIGSMIQFPYGAFSSDQDQTTTANTATLVTFNTTDFANDVSITASKITVQNAGIYNLQFSVQVESDDVAPQDVFIWLRQGNGGGGSVDITGSTGKVGLPARKSPGDPFHSIIGWNYYLSMAVDDYVQIYWSTTSANVSIQHYPASGTPTKPSTQSVVATLSFVSALP